MAIAGSTVIRKCQCKSEFQNQKYGQDNRVHNIGHDEEHCTVCGSVKKTPRVAKPEGRE